MCGILGMFTSEKKDFIQKGLAIQQNRGRDSYGFATEQSCTIAKQREELHIEHENNCIAHNLHSIVGHVPQPLKKQGIFVSNCEIYNWKELNAQHKLCAQNDAQLLFLLLEKFEITKVLDMLDGVYAFCYWKDDTVYLARDIIGVKPLHYTHKNGLYFASESKTLREQNIESQELNPRQIIQYTISTDTMQIIQRSFFSQSTLDTDQKNIEEQITALIQSAVDKRLTEKKVGVLFSGGIDSVYIAYLLKQKGIAFTCYTAGIDDQNMPESDDIIWAKKAAKLLDLKLTIVTEHLENLPHRIQQTVNVIESTNVVKVGVALPFYLCCEQAKKDGIQVMFSGLGSEEIFAGYKRHEESQDINQECISGLRKIYERDLYRDDAITMHFTQELRLPFLDKKLIEKALTIPQELKIYGEHKKYILRLCAQNIGIPKDLAFRPKKAAQYGSRFDKAIEKVAKKKGFVAKSAYLATFFPAKNQRLALLCSTGKDSWYAAHIMHRQHYPIVCAITINSTNQDSYMFHTPNVSLAALQCEAASIPLIEKQTAGEKELELQDLQDAIQQAKEAFGIEGVITGALYSVYQRERIEEICERLGLKVFSPLWHVNQAKEMRELLTTGFKIIFTSVAAEGLNKTWLNIPISHKHVDALEKLNQKVGLNIAGEGGEFESLVLDCPMFEKKLVVVESSVHVDETRQARLTITKAELQDKSL